MQQGLNAWLCQRFVWGLPVSSASLLEELLAAVVAEPVLGAVRYILHTKVQGWGERSVGQGNPYDHHQGYVWDSIPFHIPRRDVQDPVPIPRVVHETPSLSLRVYRILSQSLGAYVRPYLHPQPQGCL